MQKARALKVLSVLVLLITVSLFGLNKTETTQLRAALKLLEEHQPGQYSVLNVEDGDTITVAMNGQPEKVRFIGVDTPETHHPDKPIQCYGPEATDFTNSLIAGQTVRLEADPKDDNRDIYGRLLRYVYLPDGSLLNAELIKAGYGFAYTHFPFEKKPEFIELEKEAKQQGKGLWKACRTIKNKYGSFETQPR